MRRHDYSLFLNKHSQEPVLFDTSVRENVELGARNHEKVMALDIERALAAANALEFVKILPHGVETIISGGTALSGGQVSLGIGSSYFSRL